MSENDQTEDNAGETKPLGEKTALHQSFTAEPNKYNKKSWPDKIPKRYILGILAFFGFYFSFLRIASCYEKNCGIRSSCVGYISGNIYALRVNLSVAVVAMTKNKTVTNNGTEILVKEADFTWNASVQGLVLSSFFYGYIITQLPGGYLSNKYGGKYLFGGGIFATAVLTLLTPLFVRWNVYLLIVTRIIEGFCEGVTYPSIHALWSKWAPPLEKTKLATLAFSGSYFGTVIALPLSGALADSSAGWPSIFYVTGCMAVFWFLFWCYFVTESPSKHSTISNNELEYIQQSIGYTDEQTKSLHPPWKDIFRSAPVWAIVSAHFAENWGFYTWLTLLPSFVYNVLGYEMSMSGFLTALPYLCMGIIVQCGGQLADFLRSRFSLSTTLIRKVFTCGAFAVQVVFMVLAGYSHNATSCIVCLTIAVGIGGFAWSGFSVNHLDVAPQYASILMGVSNTFATIPGIISPSLSNAIIVDKQDKGQWQVVFYIAAAVYLGGAITYGVFASGYRERWADIPHGYTPQLEDEEKDDQ